MGQTFPCRLQSKGLDDFCAGEGRKFQSPAFSTTAGGMASKLSLHPTLNMTFKLHGTVYNAPTMTQGT